MPSTKQAAPEKPLRGSLMSVRSLVELRSVSLDHLSDVRHVSALAYRAYAGPLLAEDQVDALVELVRSPEYSEQILAANSVGAWIDGHLCGIAGWSPAGNAGAGAKLIGVCVDPLFGRLGIGRRLVAATEMRARRAGFTQLTARVPANAAPFFERVGYLGSSQGVWITPAGVSVPVFHMRKGVSKPTRQADQHHTIPVPSIDEADTTRVH